MTNHQFAGLQIQSNQPIPGLPEIVGAGNVDLEIWLQTPPPWNIQPNTGQDQVYYVRDWFADNGRPGLIVWSCNEGAALRLRYHDDTEFVVDREGKRIWATWPDDATVEDTATYLLGPVMGLVLRLRGFPCLHASAIVVGNQAVAFLGGAGAGKSMTAAAFAMLGRPVLTDDILVLGRQDDVIVAHPTYPRLRLWPESVENLFGAPDALPRITPNNPDWDKCHLDLTGDGYQFQDGPLPLGAIYFLGERSGTPAAPFVETINGADALIALVANTYVNYLLDQFMRAYEFGFLGELLQLVPLRRVIPHRNPARLMRMCQVILEDFHSLDTLPVKQNHDRFF